MADINRQPPGKIQAQKAKETIGRNLSKVKS